MNCIDRHISYLISHHDCVIVPGLGAFVAQYTPARIDAEHGLIIPPLRKIGFNQSLDHNDGLLASSIARSSGIGYDAAVATVAQQVASLRSQLQTDGEISIGHIGSLTDKSDGIMEFQPFASPIISPDYFGLTEKSIAKVIKIAKEKERLKENAVVRRNRLAIIVRNSVRVAASIALLLGLGIMLSTPIIVDRQAPSMASVSSVTTVTPPKATSAAALLPTNHDAKLYLAATTKGYEIADTAARSKYAVRLKAAARQTAFKTTEPDATPAIRMNESDPYCLIVASLSTAEDAERYLSQNSDKRLRCLAKDGKFRIYAATGSNVAEASIPTRSSAFNKRYPGAWVCHR